MLFCKSRNPGNDLSLRVILFMNFFGYMSIEFLVILAELLGAGSAKGQSETVIESYQKHH